MDGTSSRPASRHRGMPVLCAVIIVIANAGAVALAACGGTAASGATSSPMMSAGATTGRASPVATPTTPAQIAAAYAAALDAFRSPITLFDEDARLEDRSLGDIRVGVKAIKAYQDFWFSGPSAGLVITSRSHFAGRDGAIVELIGEAGGTAVYGVDVLRVSGGRITAWYVYYSDWLSDRVPELEPALLATTPGPSDTEAASRAVAAEYMSALRDLSPAQLAPLYAAEVVYQDTSRDVRYPGPSSALAAHAKMFALKGVAFRAAGVLAGPGWAAVMWRRIDREGGEPPPGFPAELATAALRPSICGLSVLEIRDGAIARETIYCDHLRTRY